MILGKKITFMTDVRPSSPSEGWIDTKWRPAMGWSYFVICIFDFILFPIGNAVLFAKNANFEQWHPLTLQNGGLYHMAMGAIVGVTSWQRSNEKMASIRSDAGSYSESSTTQTVVSKDTTKVAPVTPTKVDIKTDTVQVNTADNAENSRAD